MPRASPCLRPIWTAFTLVIRILHRSRSRALRLSLLQVASVEGRRSNSTKTCATCCIPPVLPLIFVVRQPCCLIGRLHSHLSFRAVNPKGCSPRRTLLLPARVFRSRKTLARRDHAAAPKPHRLIVHMVPACGPVFYSDEYPKQKPKRRLKKQRKKRNYYCIGFLPFQNIYLHTLPHTRVYFLHQLRTKPPVYSLSVSGRTGRLFHMSFAAAASSSGIPIWVYFWRFLLLLLPTGVL